MYKGVEHFKNFCLPKIDILFFHLLFYIIITCMAPLPPNTRIAIWDVTNLYSNVDNGMGIPAVDRLLGKYPNPDGIPKQCILDGLEICLRCNACRYQPEDGKWR
jgi:hypothetical protein